MFADGVAARFIEIVLGFYLFEERLDCHILCCRGHDKLFQKNLVVGCSRLHVFHESAEGFDEVVLQDSAWWWNLGASPICRWLHSVSVVRDLIDMRGGIGQAEGIRGGVGVSNDALERLLRILEVGLPLFPSPVESRQTFELKFFVMEAFLFKEGAGCDGNKPRVRYGKSGLPGLPLCVLGAGNELWESWFFDPPG